MKRHVVFHVDGLSCRHRATHVRNALRTLPGVLSASVRFPERTAYVCHDAQVTEEREIIVNMARRGFWLSPALGLSVDHRSWLEAPRLGITIALLGNLIALAHWPHARSALRLPWVELGFALLLITLTSPSLVRRAHDEAKRGIWGADFVALVAAFTALAMGIAGLFVGNTVIPLTPNFLLRFGPRPDGASAVAFEAAGAITGFGFLSNYVRAAILRRPIADLDHALRQHYMRVRRVLPEGTEVLMPRALVSAGDRVRLFMGDIVRLDFRLEAAARVATNSGSIEDRVPGQMVFRGERLVSIVTTGRIESTSHVDVSAAADAEVARETQRIEDAAWRREDARVETLIALTLTIAMTWLAVFAVLVHALSTRMTLHPGVVLAGVAVLAGASPAAFVFGVALARMVVVLQARAKGIVVKNVATLDTLATVDCAFFNLSGHVFLDAPRAFRALWHRNIACRVLVEDPSGETRALGDRFGVATTASLASEAMTDVIRATHAAGGRVLLVGPGTPVQMLPVDVVVAVAPNEVPSTVVAPIVLRVPNLLDLVWLFDAARALRSRTRVIAVLTLIYTGMVIPLCATGLMGPLVAASLSLGFTMATYWFASRVGVKPGQPRVPDKLLPASHAAFPVDSGMRHPRVHD